MIFLINVKKSYGVITEKKKCCGGLFADDIVLLAPTKSSLKKPFEYCS